MFQSSENRGEDNRKINWAVNLTELSWRTISLQIAKGKCRRLSLKLSQLFWPCREVCRSGLNISPGQVFSNTVRSVWLLAVGEKGNPCSRNWMRQSPPLPITWRNYPVCQTGQEFLRPGKMSIITLLPGTSLQFLTICARRKSNRRCTLPPWLLLPGL